MDLFEIYCSESELSQLFRARRKKPISVLRQLKAATLDSQSIPSYATTEFWDDEDTEAEAGQEAQLLDYELAKARAQLARATKWEKSVQRQRAEPIAIAAAPDHRRANAAALKRLQR